MCPSFDPAQTRWSETIHGIEVNHGAAVAPTAAVTTSATTGEKTLDVVEVEKTLKVPAAFPLSGLPTNIAISKDGKRVYVSIAVARARSMRRHRFAREGKTIPVKGAGSQHVCQARTASTSSAVVGAKTITVIDQKT